jgi:hypothetical protein
VTGARTYALVGWSLAVIGAVGAIAVRVVEPAPFLPVTFGFGPTAMVAFLAMGLSWASIGAFLMIRRPDNGVGWIMVASGMGYSQSMLWLALTFAFAADGTAEGQRLAEFAGWMTVLGTQIGALAFLVGFVFPTGRAQSPRWELVVKLSFPMMVLFAVALLLQPGSLHLFPTLQNPFGIGPDIRAGEPVSPLVGVFAVSLAPLLACSLALRYRTGGPTERQQLKWIALALVVALFGVGFAAWGAVITGRPPGEVGLTVYGLAAATVPLAIAIAILRHHLYDIDHLISRSLSYAIVTAALAGVFAAAAVSLGTLLGSQGERETFQIAGATLLVAALFGPVRRRAQGAVDRRFDRARYDGERTAIAFSARLRDETDMATVTSDLTQTAASSVAPSTLSIWLRGE